MNHPLAQLVRERFADFTAGYLADPGDGFAYRLKIAHTARVTENAVTIAKAEGLPDDLALASTIAANLHDVGRFPQFRNYHTFRDADSANHGLLGVSRILRRHILEGLPRDLKRLILGAVFLHNARSLPPALPRPLELVTRVVRDSDKLDIYSVLIRHFSRTESDHPEITLHCKDDPMRFSPKIMDALLRHEPGDYRDVAFANDFILLVIGWVYDLGFRTSLRLLKERGLTDKLFAFLPDTEQVATYRARVETDLAGLLVSDYLPGERLVAAVKEQS